MGLPETKYISLILPRVGRNGMEPNENYIYLELLCLFSISATDRRSVPLTLPTHMY